ncbi:unnamed protein product [Durusdinium trenchii]|uniref:beta-N-acetylhexosaminidase n=1 Tax=Durusdinium trenchii TaxID=1381693 RepID=A0ABP0MXP7_9DINO
MAFLIGPLYSISARRSRRYLAVLSWLLCHLGARAAKFGDLGASLLQVKADPHDTLSLIPQPKTVRVRTGRLELHELRYDAPSAPPALRAALGDVLGATPGASGAAAGLRLMLQEEAEDFHPEGYRLNVSEEGIALEASTEHGLFNGLMTLRQLMVHRADSEGGGWSLQKVEIEDAPEFAWRGLMLDVSRHFFSPTAVKHLLKTMALFKMNHFHWHLTDDQGWRFPVAKYPNLIRLGAHRRATQQGHSSATDGRPYNHSYTEEEIHEVLSLAESLYIEVVPEFDIPGHSQALIASYPEMGNADSAARWSPEVATHFGALQYTLSPSERSVNFTKDVLSEMAQLFQASPYVHIGGDEVPTAQWEHSPSAMAVARKEHVSLKRLEGMMLGKAAEHLHGLGRKAVVWDDAMESGGHLPDDAVVMIWRSWEGLEKLGNRAFAQGHSVVLAPQAYTYLDQWQDRTHSHFDAIGGFLPLSTVYASPTHAGRAHVLGIQGQLWSEYIREGSRNLDYMAWPRGCALAEVGWSGEGRGRFRDFRQRLAKRLEDFKLYDINLGEM